jgi:hypothetical protein
MLPKIVGYAVAALLVLGAWVAEDFNVRLLLIVCAIIQVLVVALGAWDWLWYAIAAPIRRRWLEYNDHTIPWLERKTTFLLLLGAAALALLGYFDLAYSGSPGIFSILIPVGGVIMILAGVWLGVSEFRSWRMYKQKRKAGRRVYVLREE